MGMGPWNRGNVLVGLHGIWQDAATKPAKGDCWNKDVHIDLGLVVSNDGVHFREPVPNFKIIARGEPGAWDDVTRRNNTDFAVGQSLTALRSYSCGTLIPRRQSISSPIQPTAPALHW